MSIPLKHASLIPREILNENNEFYSVLIQLDDCNNDKINLIQKMCESVNGHYNNTVYNFTNKDNTQEFINEIYVLPWVNNIELLAMKNGNKKKIIIK